MIHFIVSKGKIRLVCSVLFCVNINEPPIVSLRRRCNEFALPLFSQSQPFLLIETKIHHSDRNFVGIAKCFVLHSFSFSNSNNNNEHGLYFGKTVPKLSAYKSLQMNSKDSSAWPHQEIYRPLWSVPFVGQFESVHRLRPPEYIISWSSLPVVYFFPRGL